MAHEDLYHGVHGPTLKRLTVRSTLCRVLRGVAFLGAFAMASDADAQLRRPRAEVAPIVEGRARAGAPVRVALEVSLPEGLHTQSNKPRDPNLIPTVLTIDAPQGVTVGEIVWPHSTDFTVAGQDQPLAVFEREFLVGVQLAIAPGTPNG